MIAMKGVKIRRAGFTLELDGLRFSPGLTLLAGRNGAGKSTLLHVLATALLPNEGYVQYGHSTVDDNLPLIRSQIGFVPSGLELYDDMTAGKFLQYFCSLKGIPAEIEVRRVLELLDMWKLSRTKIKHLSQGKKQKVAIAQALLGEPYLLLLDEPLNYLDSRERKLVIQLLTRYARERVVIVATHELNEWNDQMDSLLWLDEGHVRFYGTPSEWVEGLEKKVWVGPIRSDQLQDLVQYDVIHLGQQEEGKMLVRMIAKYPPSPAFNNVPITAEDAYFIRRSEAGYRLNVVRHP